MKLCTFFQSTEGEWSIKEFPTLDSPDTLVIIFGDSSLLDKAENIQQLLAHFKNSVVVGCSTAGEIFETEVNDRTLSVAVLAFEHSSVRQAHCNIAHPDNSNEAGQQLASQLLSDDLQSVFVLSDGLNVNGSELVKGINEGISKKVVISGGLAGDGDRFQRTWVLSAGKLRQNCITAVGLYGDRLRFGHGAQGGWDLFGPERLVTRSKGNILFELDEKPALTLYKQYLGELSSDLPASGLRFPLAIVDENESEDNVVRTILGIDEEAGSLIFAGDIPQGKYVQLMHANFDRLIDGAIGAAQKIQLSDFDRNNILSIAVSCVGRRLVLKDRTEEETEATLSVLPSGSRQIGFYSYGELSPITDGNCGFHNQTMTLTLVSEV